MVNNIIGPEMVPLPYVFLEAGLIPALVTLIISAVLSCQSSILLIEAFARIPSDRVPPSGIEYVDGLAFWLRLGPAGTEVLRVLYAFTLQALNVVAIIVCAQILDQLIALVFGSSVLVDPLAFAVRRSGPDGEFSLAGLPCPITLGLVVAAIVFLPMSFLPLCENMRYQWASLVALLAFTAYTLGLFWYKLISGTDTPTDLLAAIAANASAGPMMSTGIHHDSNLHHVPQTQAHGIRSVIGRAQTHSVPLVGASFSSLVGVSLMTAYAVTVPSWLNEKSPGVPPRTVLWLSTAISFGLKVAFGWIGAVAMTPAELYADGRRDTLDALVLYADAVLGPRFPPISALTKVSVWVFTLAVIGLGIPLQCVFVRNNFLPPMSGSSSFHQAYRRHWLTADLVGCYLPWCVAPFVYSGPLFVAFISWSTLLLGVSMNFILPMVVYVVSVLVDTDDDAHTLNYSQRRKKLPILSIVCTIVSLILVFILLFGSVIINIEHPELVS